MGESQPIGPQRSGAVGILAAVADVAQQGQLAGGELHPDLVGAAGVELDPHQRKIFGAADLPVLQLSLPDAFAHPLHHKALVVGGVTEEKVGEGIRFLFRVAPEDGQILLGDAVFRHQRRQLAGDLLAAGKDHHAAGDFVQPVDGGNIVVLAQCVIMLTQPAGHALDAAVILGEVIDRLAAHHQMGVFV